MRTPTLDPAPARNVERTGIILAVLCTCQFMVLLDMTIVNVSLEAIRTDLSLTTSSLSYVATAYTTLLGGFLMLSGRAADLVGRRPLLIGGMALFAAASCSAALAQQGWHLFVSRGAQGLGAALLTTAALATLTSVFEEGAARNRALGVWGALAGAGSAVGVVLGGVLTDGPGWRWVFWLNVPVGLAAIVAVIRYIPPTAGERARRLDAPGAVALTCGMLLLIAGISRTEVVGWISISTLAFLAGGVALIVAFLAIERRTPHPLIDMRIFRRHTLRAANVVGLLSYGAGAGFFFVSSLLMQQVFGYSPLKTGFAYVPVAIAVLVGAQTAARLTPRVGAVPVVLTSLAVVGAGYLLVARAPAKPVFWIDLLGPFILVGLFLGAIFVAVQILAFQGVAPQQTGLAAGLINTSQEAGSAFGVAILSTVAATRISHLVADSGATSTSTLHSGYRYALMTNAGLLLVALTVAAALLHHATTR